MKVTVSENICIASGNCSMVAPHVFANPPEEGGFVRLLDSNPPASEWDAVREAESLCPAATIRIDEEDASA